ncbi:FAD-dependent oxidoreductase [Brachybacterium alimentarium]|uniref:FAD-dependent oxidoreductase n=1 Tax=Brachybacterium alimentarium TaxID=47845 RepID=UPI000BB73105|nr:FAD-dependent oxidoreductase [Brachybacterium alimentarium]PCC33128.1 FAD-dependent oxidoreductase [Brachybacterium alimentarium]RCS93594.1 FAD-dependent oxidoreductase [Brachybacterium alimentarium]
MREYTRSLTIEKATDVVVVGSGPAGLAAAIAAARGGASVRLVERYGFLGGNLTGGLVGPCMTSFSLDGKTQLIRGIFDEFVRRMESLGGAVHPSQTVSGSPYSGFMTFGHEAVTPFDPEVAKRVSMEMALEAGVELLLHSMVVDTVVEDGTVTGIVIAHKGGMSFVPATVTIDASGDGDVAARGGAAFDYGRDSDGGVQPMTLFFRVRDVDDEAVSAYQAEHPDERFPFQSIVERAHEAGTYSLPRRGVQLFKTLESGVWRVNTTRVTGVNGTNVHDLTTAEVAARQQVVQLLEFFHHELPGMGSCRLLDTASTIGVRETRRIVGIYSITLDDLVAGRAFDDVIAVAGYPVDIHSPTSINGPFDDGVPPTANVYEIPYRALVPAQLDGLIMAGRCISGSHEALAAIRVMPPAFAIGEAAGVAAARAVFTHLEPREVDVADLQTRLLNSGAYLGARMDIPDLMITSNS